MPTPIELELLKSGLGMGAVEPTPRELLSRGLLGAGIQLLKADPYASRGQQVGAGLEGFIGARQQLREQKALESAKQRQILSRQKFAELLPEKEKPYAELLDSPDIQEIIKKKLMDKAQQPVSLLTGETASSLGFPTGSIIQQGPEGYKAIYTPPEYKPEKETGSARFAIPAGGGEAQIVREDASGRLYHQNGTPVKPGEFAGFLGSVSPQAEASLGGTLGTKAQVGQRLDQVRNSIASTVNAGEIISDIIGSIKANPKVIGVPGTMANLLNEASQAMLGSAGLVGIPEEDRKFLDPNNYTDVWKDIRGTAVASGPLMSSMQSLAYAVAKTNNLGGKISDADFRAALKEIGGNSSDPEKITQTLGSVFKRSLRNTRTNIRMNPEISKEINADVLGEVESQLNQTMGVKPIIELPKSRQELSLIEDEQAFQDALTPAQKAEMEKRLKEWGLLK